MNKGELVDSIYESLDRSITKANITTVVGSLIDTIQNTVANGDKVTIVGFGAFEKRDRQPRTGRNPRTGEVLEIAASSIPAFSAGKGFKELVNDAG